MRYFSTLLAAVSILTVSCATTESDLHQQGLKPASASLVSSTLIGNTLVGTTSDRNPFEVLYRPDGTGVFRSDTYVETGTWRISEDGLMCTRWVRLRNGAEACNRQYLNGDKNMAFTSDGKYAATYKIIAGNPGKL